VPAPDELLTMHPVSTSVNNVRNKGAELLDEVEHAAMQLPT
jgi:putative SOS response-associated peptidase YedK